MRSSIYSLLVCVLFACPAWAQAQGTITGTVLDEGGRPMVGAKVLIAEKGVLVGHSIVDYHETDENGRFRISHVHWGTYVVVAGKESAGYPDPAFASFYAKNAMPIVTLAEDFPSTDIILKIGPKAAILNLEPVTDAATGKEIRSAAIKLRRAANPDLFIYTSAAQRRILVPPLTDVLIEISAEGYKPWPSQGVTPDRGKIFLKPDEVLEIQVTLQPDDPADVQEKK